MKSKLPVVILTALVLGLAFWLYRIDQRAKEEVAQREERIARLSTDLVSTTDKLNEQVKVNTSLETSLTQRVEELGLYSNKWTLVTADLKKTEAEAAAAAEAFKEEIARRDKQIAGLETQKDELGKKMEGLNGQIGALAGQIQETERKLAASEGDREFLKKELKRLMAEKAELERKFQDLAVLREQVKKLKEELSIARRLEFIRKGLYGDKKGAQLLSEGVRKPAVEPAKVDGALKVEVKSDGTATVAPPAPAPAPAAPATPAPAPAPAK